MGMGALPRRAGMLTLIMPGDRRPRSRPAPRGFVARDGVIASYRHIAVWHALRLQRLSVRSIHYPGVLASPGPESARRAGNSARASSTQ